MAEADVVIAGTILLDPAQALDGAIAEVRLREAALADAPSRTVASVRIPCTGASVRAIPFALPARIDPGADYALAADVRRGGKDRLHPGDLLTTRHNGWTAGHRGEVTLTVRPIR